MGAGPGAGGAGVLRGAVQSSCPGRRRRVRSGAGLGRVVLRVRGDRDLLAALAGNALTAAAGRVSGGVRLGRSQVPALRPWAGTRAGVLGQAGRRPWQRGTGRRGKPR